MEVVELTVVLYKTGRPLAASSLLTVEAMARPYILTCVVCLWVYDGEDCDCHRKTTLYVPLSKQTKTKFELESVPRDEEGHTDWRGAGDDGRDSETTKKEDGQGHAPR